MSNPSIADIRDFMEQVRATVAGKDVTVPNKRFWAVQIVAWERDEAKAAAVRWEALARQLGDALAYEARGPCSIEPGQCSTCVALSVYRDAIKEDET